MKITKGEINAFLDYLRYERNYSKDTIASYTYDLNKFDKYLVSIHVSITEVTRDVVREFLANELSKNISNRSCERRFAALSHFYSYLVEQKIIKISPLKFIKMKKRDRKLPEVLYPEQIEELFTSNKKRTDFLATRDQAIIEFLYSSGLRASELVNLILPNVDMNNRFIRVLGKESKERVVPFSKDASVSLSYYIKNVRPKLLETNLVARKENHLFLNSHGSKLTTRGLEYILKQIQMKCGLSFKLHPHVLRHSYATALINGGVDIRIIQELLGHSNINTTSIYTHISDEHVKEDYFKSHPRARKK